MIIIFAKIKNTCSHISFKLANKCPNVRERMEVVGKNKDGTSLPLLSRELSLCVCDRKPNTKKSFSNL